MFWLLLLSFSFTIIIVLYLASPLALVADITVSGNVHLGEEDILAIANVNPGDHLWRIKIGASRDKLLTNPWISEVIINRVFPNYLAISVQERQGTAVIADTGTSWVASGDGVILEENTDSSLPWITGLILEGLEPGKVLDGQALALALDWLVVLKPLNSQVSELNLSAYPANVVLFTTDGYKVVFPLDTDIEQRVWDLNALLKELRAENTKGVIDFRTAQGKAIFSQWPGNTGPDN